nr:hypothetical protein [Tanacetum cinerariifolium]
MPLLFVVLAFYRTRVAGLCWGMMVEVMGSSGSGGEEAKNVREVVAEMVRKSEFGDSYEAPLEESGIGSASESSAKKKGRTVAVTTEDMQKRRNDVKARTTLLLALLDEHQLRFNMYKTTQELWGAILKTFGGNEATKKTKKNQLKRQYMAISRQKIDEDDIEEMDIKWNMALLSMRADRFWKKTGKKITIQGTDVAGFGKSKVKCFNCHKIGHFARKCRAPRSQDKRRRENYRQGSKEEEPAPKALMAIDRVGWDWSYMANEEENHALVADDEAPTEFALIAKSSSSSENDLFDNSLCFKSCKKNTDSLNTKITNLNEALSDSKTNLYYCKLGLSQVEARLVEFKTQEIKLCEKIRGLEFDLKNKNIKIKNLMNELEQIRKRKKYCSPSPAQVYSPPKKDTSWTGLPEFADDTITDYSKPSPSIESNSNDLQNYNSSVSENEESSSSILSKLVIKFVKPADSPTVIKTNKDETVRKPSVKYAEMEKLLRPQLVGFGDLSNTLLAKGNPQNNIDDKGYWDSGCSRHMTGNISYLSDYEPYDGGYVSFGQGGGKITGRDFKLKDNTNVLLRTPRQHNMYSIDLNNIVPHKDLTCLVAKASADESMLWHRRIGHLDFKTMNKLGKQHKASCKIKLINLVSKPLHTLHMELSGPTSVSSLNHKWYCLVVTDDFSRVLVNKFQNKTPYELFNSRAHARGFLRPFGCHVMIFNTLDHLGKFDAKGDEDFLENKLIEKGVGPNWLFDIDTLTNSMNYVPVVVAGTSSTNFSGTTDVASQGVKKDVSSLRYIALPNWFHEAHLESSTSNAHDTCNAAAPESSGNINPTATSTNPPADQMETLTVETLIPTVSSLVLTACLDDSPKTSSDTRIILKRVISQDETPSLDNISTLTNRIHKDHPKSQIIGHVDTPVQNRHKSKEMKEHNFIATIHQKTYSDLLQFCLFSCFLSQEEPKKIFDALKDPSWVEAMQEQLLQFKIQEVWILVDCPKGNKARLVAQGYTQEEGIDYEEVFAPVKRIEAIILFLAYALFMGFIVYQMDVKSAFLYGTIDEEVYVMQPPRFQDPEFPDRVYKVQKAMGAIDQTLFIRKHRGDFLLVQVYVDDIIFGSSNPQLCREFEALMHDKFQMNAMGELNFFLGFQVTQKKDDIFLSQDKYALTINPIVYVLHIRQFWSSARIETTNEGTKILATVDGRTIPLFETMLITQGEGSGTPTEPHHTPSLQEQQLSSHHVSPSISHPIATTETIPTETPTEIPTLRQYSRRATRIAQSKALPTAANEPAYLLRDDSQGEALLTVSGLKAGQDRENIIKTSDLPRDSTPRVTSLDADKGRMSMEIGEEAEVEKSTERGSNDTEELLNVLTSMDAANILTSGVQAVSVPPVAEVFTIGVSTGSGSIPTVSAIFTTASVVTPYSRHKGKEKMVESDTPKKKKLQEQIDVQMAREMKEQMAREDQRMNEQIARDAKIAMIHAEEELKIMIDGLDKSNKVIAKHIQEGMTLEEIREKFISVWKQIEDFVPMASKEEGERVKRKGLKLEQGSAKKMKTSDDVSEEDLKEMMQLVPVEEVYVEALQVKHSIID